MHSRGKKPQERKGRGTAEERSHRRGEKAQQRKEERNRIRAR